jgi:hypothetical protein
VGDIEMGIPEKIEVGVCNCGQRFQGNLVYGVSEMKEWGYLNRLR